MPNLICNNCVCPMKRPHNILQDCIAALKRVRMEQQATIHRLVLEKQSMVAHK